MSVEEAPWFTPRDLAASRLVLRVLRRCAGACRSERLLREAALRAGIGKITLGNAVHRLRAAGAVAIYRHGGERMVRLTGSGMGGKK